MEADEGYEMEILYTPTNVIHRLAQFETFLKDEHIFEDDDLLGGERGLVGTPERIIILPDVMCGSSGDTFVDIMKKCSI